MSTKTILKWLSDSPLLKSLFTTKGDIAVATGNATPVRQGVGSDGQVIIANSAQTNGIEYTDYPDWMGRNAVINGNFDICQRRQQIATASRARNGSNVATIVCGVNHGLVNGNTVSITGLGGTGYNTASASVTVTNATTFTYANTGSSEGTTADTAGLIINLTNIQWINPATLTYTLDRYKTAFAVDGGTNPNVIHSQQIFTPGTLFNSKNFYRVNVDGAGSSYGANSYYIIAHYIENGTSKLCGNGKKVTVSIQGTSDITNKKLGVYLIQNYGTGGSPTAQEAIVGTNFTLTSSLVRNSYTFTTNTLTGKTFGTNNDDALIVCIVYEWGSTFKSNVGAAAAETFVGSGNIDIAQLQLCAGDVALEYQPRDWEWELLKCMRYYQTWNVQYGIAIRMRSYNVNAMAFHWPCLVPMRIENANMGFLGIANIDYGIYDINNNLQTGFTISANATHKQFFVINASKTAHGLTDGYFGLSTTLGAINLDADF